MRYFLLLSIAGVAVLSSNVSFGEGVVLTEDNAGAISGNFACHPGGMAPGGTAPQSFYRAFKLSAFINPADSPYLEIDRVGFAVGMASSGSGTGQPLNVNLYTTLAIPPTLANLTLVRSAALTIPDESSASGTATFSPAPLFNVASDTLVVEVAVPDGRLNNNYFAMGFNSVSQTAPSYYRASDCGESEPADTAVFGAVYFPITASGQGRASTPVTLQSFFVD